MGKVDPAKMMISSVSLNRSALGTQHLALADSFKDTDRARLMIRRLMEIEQLSPNTFDRVETLILGAYDEARELWGTP